MRLEHLLETVDRGDFLIDGLLYDGGEQFLDSIDGRLEAELETSAVPSRSEHVSPNRADRPCDPAEGDQARTTELGYLDIGSDRPTAPGTRCSYTAPAPEPETCFIEMMFGRHCLSFSGSERKANTTAGGLSIVTLRVAAGM